MKNYIIGSFVMLALLLGTAAIPGETAHAAPQGNAWGYWTFPGNSLYGRMHNKHFVYRYYWAGEGYETWEEYIEGIQDWLDDMRSERHGGYDTDIEVSTRSATNIDEDSATLRGEVDIEDSDYAYVWFQYGERSTNLNRSTTKQRVDEDDDEYFSRTIHDLREGETYYFRAVGTDEENDKDYGSVRSFTTDGDTGDEYEPEAITRSATDTEDDSAELRGRVEMNDFNNGVVFFVYGEDEDQVEDVDNDYDTYGDIDEDGDDLQKIRVDTDLDGVGEYSPTVGNLDEDTRIYFAIGVAYEDEDGDDVIELGTVRSFTTGDSDDQDEPDATTDSAEDVTDDSAELYGEIDMNDFDNGIVFFVYGEDLLQIDDVEDDYDTYGDIDEDGDDLQKVKVDNDLDTKGDYRADVGGLDDDRTHYFAIGVQYEDEDGDDVLKVGNIRSFRTD